MPKKYARAPTGYECPFQNKSNTLRTCDRRFKSWARPKVSEGETVDTDDEVLGFDYAAIGVNPSLMFRRPPPNRPLKPSPSDGTSTTPLSPPSSPSPPSRPPPPVAQQPEDDDPSQTGDASGAANPNHAKKAADDAVKEGVTGPRGVRTNTVDVSKLTEEQKLVGRLINKQYEYRDMINQLGVEDTHSSLNELEASAFVRDQRRFAEEFPGLELDPFLSTYDYAVVTDANTGEVRLLFCGKDRDATPSDATHLKQTLLGQKRDYSYLDDLVDEISTKYPGRDIKVGSYSNGGPRGMYVADKYDLSHYSIDPVLGPRETLALASRTAESPPLEIVRPVAGGLASDVGMTAVRQMTGREVPPNVTETTVGSRLTGNPLDDLVVGHELDNYIEDVPYYEATAERPLPDLPGGRGIAAGLLAGVAGDQAVELGDKITGLNLTEEQKNPLKASAITAASKFWSPVLGAGEVTLADTFLPTYAAIELGNKAVSAVDRSMKDKPEADRLFADAATGGAVGGGVMRGGALLQQGVTKTAATIRAARAVSVVAKYEGAIRDAAALAAGEENAVVAAGTQAFGAAGMPTAAAGEAAELSLDAALVAGASSEAAVTAGTLFGGMTASELAMIGLAAAASTAGTAVLATGVAIAMAGAMYGGYKLDEAIEKEFGQEYGQSEEDSPWLYYYNEACRTHSTCAMPPDVYSHVTAEQAAKTAAAQAAKRQKEHDAMMVDNPDTKPATPLPGDDAFMGGSDTNASPTGGVMDDALGNNPEPAKNDDDDEPLPGDDAFMGGSDTNASPTGGPMDDVLDGDDGGGGGYGGDDGYGGGGGGDGYGGDDSGGYGGGGSGGGSGKRGTYNDPYAGAPQAVTGKNDGYGYGGGG